MGQRRKMNLRQLIAMLNPYELSITYQQCWSMTKGKGDLSLRPLRYLIKKGYQYE